MSRWAVLPAELDPRVRQLVVRLRRLKDHSGLSLRRLAARTPYSAKSWERYLGGRSLPPRGAVEALAAVGGEDPTRLLALHELAVDAWGKGRSAGPEAGPAETGGTAAPPQAVSCEAGAARPAGSVWVVLVAGSVALALAAASAVLLAVRQAGPLGAPAAPLAAAVPPAPAPATAPSYACRPARVDGRWYAGNSPTRDTVLAGGQAGAEVAEAQCLLRRAGFSPGAVDGVFGPPTEHAVRRLQKRAGLVVDGIVGPPTWKALRR